MPDEGTQDRYCKGCGYSLRGLASNCCPECGREFDAVDPRTTASSAKTFRLRKWSRATLLVLGLIALSYVAAYVALVRPIGVSFRIGPPYPLGIPKSAQYAIRNDWISRIFEPINALDRRIRTDTWIDYGVSAECLSAAKTIDRAWYACMGLEKEISDPAQRKALLALMGQLDDVIFKADSFRPGNPEREELLSKSRVIEAELNLAIRKAGEPGAPDEK